MTAVKSSIRNSLIGLLDDVSVEITEDNIPDAGGLVHDGDLISFADLLDQSNLIAGGLVSRGIGRGDRIAIWLANRPDWAVWLLACARLGAICVAVNTRFRSAEVEDILERCNVSVLVYEPGFKNIDFAAILAKVDPKVRANLNLVVKLGEESSAGANTVSSMELGLPCGRDIRDGTSDDPLLVFTTSGTTSKPKFVLHDQQSIVCHARNVAEAFAYTSSRSVLLQALPLCGTFGLSQFLAGIAGGCRTIFMPVFEAGEALRMIREHSVTTFNGPDGMFAQIVKAAKPGDLETIEWCGFAAFGESDPVEFVRSCDMRGLKLSGLYGMSETQALFARQSLNAPAQIRGLAGGDLTSAQACAEARDPQTGAVLPCGQSGELYLKGPSCFREYLGNAKATKQAIGADRFVRTGDLGYITPTGGFVFESRLGDSLRLGGFLVNPAEIDAWILDLENIAACQTVGVKTDKGLRAASFVILRTGNLDESEIIAHCRAGLAGFKVPVAVFALEKFPVSVGPNGEKIQRNKLRDMARVEFSDQ